MIKIHKSPTADTRSAKEIVSKETLLASSKQHIGDVQQAMRFMADKFIEASDKHDWTKVDFIDEFHRDFEAVQKGSLNDFKERPWFKRHVTSERHHLNDHCPEDVNLFDIMERIADITMAGMARTGTIYDDTLSPEILVKAYKNTIELIKNNTEVLK